jgi:predicted nucleotide-binding protein
VIILEEKSQNIIFELKKTIRDIQNYNREWHYSSDMKRLVNLLNTYSRKLNLPEFKFEDFHYSSTKKTINETGVISLHTHLSVLEEMLPLSHIFEKRSSNKESQFKSYPNKDNSKKVFIVHGRDKTSLLEVEGILRRVGLEPVVLNRMANSGLTLIEKFEKHSDVQFAVVLLTPDDIGALNEDFPNYQYRARQNVIFELGFFYGKLGRAKVCCLYKSGLELPTDINGVAYLPYSNSVEETEYALLKELKEAEVEFQPF